MWDCMSRYAAPLQRGNIVVAAAVEDLADMLHSEKHRSRKRRSFAVPGMQFEGCDDDHNSDHGQKCVEASLELMREFTLR